MNGVASDNQNPSLLSSKQQLEVPDRSGPAPERTSRTRALDLRHFDIDAEADQILVSQITGARIEIQSVEISGTLYLVAAGNQLAD